MRLRHAAAIGAEVFLCAIIGAAGIGILTTSVRSVRCEEGGAPDVLMSFVGAFLLGVAAWELRRS